MLYVDVNLGKATHRIVVCEGDTAESLAQSFGQKNGLDNITMQKLAELLH